MGKTADWLMILPYAAAAAMAFLAVAVCGYQYKYRKSGSVISVAESFSGMIRTKSRNTDWYKRKEEDLAKKGAPYHFGKRINPGNYYIIRMIGGFLGFGLGFSVSALCGIFAFCLIFFLPELLLDYLNRKDNERMLTDIKMIYHSLAIQIRAGIYVADALCECHRNIREKRLKAAFLDLAGDILMKADIFGSLEKLQARFYNRYIDSLCITILQALDSGQAVEVLNDIGEQIKDMENVLLDKKKNSLDRSITFYQLGILSAELIVVMYACIRYMFRMAGSF